MSALHGVKLIGEWECTACKKIERGMEPPATWATGHANFCSAPCMRTMYSGRSIAHLFPRDATDEEHAALDKHENELLGNMIRRSSNPYAVGMLAGSIFKQRWERWTAHGR